MASHLLSPLLVRLERVALSAAFACAFAAAVPAQFGAEHVITAGGPDLTDVQVADLDGDGDLDVLATHNDEPAVTWHRNLGGGVFGGAIALHASDPFFFESAEAVRTFDLDQDGDRDVVAAESDYHPDLGLSQQVIVYRNAGGGSFTEAGSYHVVFTSVAGLEVADLEGDGDDDIFYGLWGDASVVVLQTAHGTLPFAPTLVTTESFAPRSILPQDLDGDGDSDLVVTSSLDTSITWYENTGSLPFGPEQVISAAVAGAGAVSAADFDGDGDVDVAAGGTSSGVSHLRWYANQGGRFDAHPIAIGSTHPASLKTADLDDDGDQDLLVGETSGLSWYANDGQGEFGPRQPIGGPTFGTRDAHAADIDGDDVLDVLTGANPGSEAEISWFPSLLTEPWTNLLSGLTGVLGTPSLVGSGTLEIGSSGSLVLSAAKPSAFGMLFTSLASTPAPFKGGTLVPVPVLLSFPVATNPAGQLPLAWSSWPAGLSGASLYLQYAIADAAGPFGVSLSNALRADVP